MHVVGAAAILGQDGTQFCRAIAVARGGLHSVQFQEGFGQSNSVGLVMSDEVDRTGRLVDRHGAYGVRLDDPEAAALNHRRSAHADGGTFDCNGDVAAAEESSIAGETPTGGDPNRSHLPGQGGEGMEGLGVEAGDNRMVRISGASASTLGEEHDRQTLAPDKVEEPVLLLMV